MEITRDTQEEFAAVAQAEGVSPGVARRFLCVVAGSKVVPGVATLGRASLEAYRIALATGRTVYDCVGLALAIEIDARSVTADRRSYNTIRSGPFAGTVLRVADPLEDGPT